MLEPLVTICSVFGGSMIRESKTFRSGTGENIYAVCIAANCWFFTARPALDMPCQDKGMPSRATRGYRS